MAIYDRFKRIVRAEWSSARQRVGDAADEVRDRFSGGADEPENARAQRPPTDAPRGKTDEMSVHYARLEVAPGADYKTVKASYRRLMKKYHPDRHATDDDKSVIANEVAASLTASFDALELHLKKG